MQATDWYTPSLGALFFLVLVLLAIFVWLQVWQGIKKLPRRTSHTRTSSGREFRATVHLIVDEPSSHWDSLTMREREVARLAAGDRSRAEIARHLGISIRTVDKHLENIYSKLKIRSGRELKHILRDIVD